MQSSLFKFMRRIEEEKNQDKKRGRDDAVCEESCREKRQKMEGAQGTLKEGTMSKLNKFMHTSGGASPCLDADSSSSVDLCKPRNDPIAAGVETKETPPEALGKSTRESSCAKDAPKSKSSEQVQYTPLEQQFLSVKAAHPDAVLFVQCGYKYQFFGEDAEIASRVLKIGCFHAHNFSTGYIPVFRLNVHLRRLVAAGYKVGVVKQVETAALKAAGDNRSGPFVRQLAGLYTRATLIGPDVEEEGGEDSTAAAAGAFLMCVSELALTKTAKKREDAITLAFMAVQPSAGNMIYDEFQDSLASFSELETRLTQIQPVEILYPLDCSPRLKQSLLDWKNYSGSDSAVLRCEALPQSWYEYNRAFTSVTEFYGRKPSSAAGGSESLETSGNAEALQVVVNLPPLVISCLGSLLEYLKPFNLQDVLSLINNLKPFSSGAHCMRLGGRTLNSLELFRNLSDGTERGSLFRILNHTQTSFGRRLLRNWLSYPLKSIRQIKLRQESVSELSCSGCPSLALLKALLHKLPDLEKKLCSVYHRKSSPSDFCNLVCTLNRTSKKMDSFSEMALSEVKSELLLDIIREIPLLLKDVEGFSDVLCVTAARLVDYENLFARPDLYPDVHREKMAIDDTKRKLQAHKKLFRAALSDRHLDYVAVSGDQYLVEVKKKDLRSVPSDWYRVSSTKQVTRFRPPYVTEALKELTQHQEQLVVCAKEAWTSVLTDFSANYGRYKKAVDKLAMADCLFSLSEVAKMPGYIRPEMVEEQVVDIRGGRHPVIDLLLDGGQYVANHTKLLGDGVRCMIITGPNMGGKSSYIKQVALVCIMAQIGSYVPAEAATLGVLDGVYTRMGAYDNILSGRSTFMVELQEASEIMKLSTEKSLVILDELGRGTSTHDGTAIAYATLQHFVEHIKCLVLFVTHYPLITELEGECPAHTANHHMSYVTMEDAEEDFERIVFLYHLERGQAGASYGLNVAALAGLPNNILQLAHKKSKKLEEEVARKLSSGLSVVQTLKCILHQHNLSSNFTKQ